MLYRSLKDFDSEIHSLIKLEENRQKNGLELIASENFTSVSVLQANGSILTNKYSEGEIGRRYYGGNEVIDKIESLCKKRALEAFNLDPEIWDVNVQVLSGSVANFAVYTGLIGKDGKIMGLDLPSGGHLTHGYKSKTRKVSATSLFFNSKSYKCNENEEIDYEELKAAVSEFKPDIIVCGGSAYVKEFDYKQFRDIAGDAYLMMDMAHVSGLILAGIMKSPFEYCDVVTTTTHKILRGPRSAMIFYKKSKTLSDGRIINVKSLIDMAVFPGLQGGPHNQKIGALAVALKQAATKEYKEYVNKVYENAQVMSEEFKTLGYKLYSNGTCCHMILVCLSDINTALVERVCEVANITLNKNCIATDKSPLKPSAIRLGTPALTTRGFGVEEFIKVVHFIHEAIGITRSVIERSTKDGLFSKECFEIEVSKDPRILDLRERICVLASKYPLPCLEY